MVFIFIKQISYSKPKNYWTYERCKEESIGCKNKLAFRTKCASAYNYS